MPRFLTVLWLASLAATPVLAQSPPASKKLAQGQPPYSGAPGAPPLTTPTLPQAAAPTDVNVPRDTTPQQPGAAQPVLPNPAWTKNPGSPVVEQIVGRPNPALTVRKGARVVARRRHVARYRRPRAPIDRPALAGVELVAPLPPPGEPPHIVVPTPAFPLESFAAAYTTPPPPIVCHPTRRERDAPDPHLYREVPVACEPDNP